MAFFLFFFTIQMYRYIAYIQHTYSIHISQKRFDFFPRTLLFLSSLSDKVTKIKEENRAFSNSEKAYEGVTKSVTKSVTNEISQCRHTYRMDSKFFPITLLRTVGTLKKKWHTHCLNPIQTIIGPRQCLQDFTNILRNLESKVGLQNQFRSLKFFQNFQN